MSESVNSVVSSASVAPVAVACCQMAPDVGHKRANLERSEGFVRKAAKAGANIIVLPELCSSGYVFQSRAEALEMSEPFEDGETTALWCQLAHELNVHIVGGFAERDGDTLYNSSALVGPQGRVGLFRKVHLWANENLFFAPGNLGFPVFATPHGMIAMAICYDGWFPETYRSCALNGAELVCVPTNWVPIPGQDEKREAMSNILTMAAAHANSVFIAAADRVGTERDQPFIGQSLIVSYTGWPIAGPASATEEEMLIAHIDLAEAKRARNWNDFNSVLRDRRPEMY